MIETTEDKIEQVSEHCILLIVLFYAMGIEKLTLPDGGNIFAGIRHRPTPFCKRTYPETPIMISRYEVNSRIE